MALGRLGRETKGGALSSERGGRKGRRGREGGTEEVRGKEKKGERRRGERRERGEGRRKKERDGGSEGWEGRKRYGEINEWARGSEAANLLQSRKSLELDSPFSLS